MRNAKLWSVLLAAVLLCASVVGVLFVGANATTPATEYTVGTGEGQYASIHDALVAAKSEDWVAGSSLIIHFSGTDASANVTTPATGESANLLFGQTTIFREDGTKLPITIQGSGEATITAPAKRVAAANDYAFKGLTYSVSGTSCVLFAGSGNVSFENVTFPVQTGYFFADNFTKDAFAGWSALEAGEYAESSISFLKGTSYASGSTTIYLGAVGYNPAGHTFAAEKTLTNSGGLIDSAVQAVLDEAAALTFEDNTGGLVTEDCYKPVNTKVALTIDPEDNAGGTLTPVFGRIGGRRGYSPVAKATVTVKRTNFRGLLGDQYIAPDNASIDRETYVGDIELNLDGVQFADPNQTYVSVRGIATANLLGNISVTVDDTANDGYDTALPYLHVIANLDSKPCIVTGTSNLTINGGHFSRNITNGAYGSVIADAFVYNGATYGGTNNTISGGTFPTGFCGAYHAAAPGPLGAVKNKISGGTFEGPFLAANRFYGSKFVGIENEISGGKFQNTTASSSSFINVAGSFFGGGNSTGSVRTFGYITNKISGGEFTGIAYLTYKDKVTGTLTNNITGGKFSAKVYCTYVSTTGNVTNTISGGNFAGNLYCEYDGSTGTLTNNIKEGISTTATTYGGCFTTADTIDNNLTGATLKTFYATYDYSDSKKASLGSVVGSVDTTLTDTTVSVYHGAYYLTKDATVKNTFLGASKVTGDTYLAYGADLASLTNEIGGTTVMQAKVYGAYNGAIDSYTMRVKDSCKICTTVSSSSKRYFYSTYQTTCGDVECYFEGGTISAEVRNIYYGTINTIKNYYSGTHFKGLTDGTSGLNSIYRPAITNSQNVEFPIYNEFSGGIYDCNVFGAFFGNTDGYAIKNVVKKGTGNAPDFNKSVYLAGYGGLNVPKAENEIGAGTYASTVYLSGGSSYWPTRIRGVKNTITGGEFSSSVYGGGYVCYVDGDIVNNVEGGNFKSFYGVSYAPLFNSSWYTNGGNNYANAYTGKALSGTVTNTVGSLTKKTGPTFANFYGGMNASGDKYTPRVIELGNIVNNVHYATITGNYYGGSNDKAFTGNRTTDSYINAVYDPTTKLPAVEGSEYFNMPTPSSDISNTLGEVTVGGAYYGGSGIATTAKNITNTINGLVLTGSYTGGSNSSEAFPSVTGSIENHFVKADFLATAAGSISHNGGSRGYSEMTEGATIKNTFEEGYHARVYTYGGSRGIQNSPDAEWAVENIINGGIFHGFWSFGGSTAGVTTGNVRNEVNGGTFNAFGNETAARNSFCGGSRNAKHIGKIETTINGGIFDGYVCGGNVSANTTVTASGSNSTIVTTINGGTFKSVVLKDEPFGGDYANKGTSTLNVVQTAGKELAFLGTTVEISTLTVNGDAIKIGKNTAIVADAASGSILFEQTEGWLVNNYFTGPHDGYALNATKAETAFGTHTIDYYPDADTKILRGVGMTGLSSSLVLGERVGMKVYLPKADVDVYGEDFTISYTIGEKTVTKKVGELAYDEEKASYVFEIEGVGLTQFESVVTIYGSAIEAFPTNVVERATTAKEVWDDQWDKLADAILNLNAVVSGKQEASPYETATPATNEQTVKAEDAMKTLFQQNAKIGLVMGDAVAVRFQLTLAEGATAPEALTAAINGNVVENAISLDSETGVYTVDLFIAARYMKTPFTVTLYNEGGEAEDTLYLTVTTNVEYLAYQLATKTDNPYAENAKALLYYIQQAVACANL